MIKTHKTHFPVQLGTDPFCTFGECSKMVLKEKRAKGVCPQLHAFLYPEGSQFSNQTHRGVRCTVQTGSEV